MQGSPSESIILTDCVIRRHLKQRWLRFRKANVRQARDAFAAPRVRMPDQDIHLQFLREPAFIHCDERTIIALGTHGKRRRAPPSMSQNAFNRLRPQVLARYLRAQCDGGRSFRGRRSGQPRCGAASRGGTVWASGRSHGPGGWRRRNRLSPPYDGLYNSVRDSIASQHGNCSRSNDFHNPVLMEFYGSRRNI